MSASRFIIAFAILLTISLLTPGLCTAADEKTASVQGVVTLDGKPLGEGRIFFHFAAGQFVGSRVDAAGAYKIDRIPPGTFKVTIEATRNGVNFLPEKYSSEETSAIKAEVKQGASTFNFDLKSK